MKRCLHYYLFVLHWLQLGNGVKIRCSKNESFALANIHERQLPLPRNYERNQQDATHFIQ
jgi:hypothetical protein